MSTTLVARYPLGTYQAHRANGRADGYPDVARLFSALVAAAGNGSTARPSDDGLSPSDDAIRALRWLEDNPPDGMRLPLREMAGAVTSYRQEGVINTVQGRTSARVAGRRAGDVVALGGPVAWTWDSEIPADIRAIIDALCADVAYLGESDSPVVLEFGDEAPTHRVDPDAGAFSGRGEQVRVPIAGRLDELERAYAAAHPAKRPSPSADRHSGGELPVPPPMPDTAHVRARRYVAVDAAPTNAPWAYGWLLGTSRVISPHQIVPWCVALHRAFAARVGEPAPSLITGAFARGVKRPANRLALHYLEPSLSPLLADRTVLPDNGAFLVSFPAGGSPEDRHAIEQAMRGLDRLYGVERPDIRLDPAVGIDTAFFWREVEPGMTRRWRSVTPLVPETRTQRDGGPRWTLADAARLSVAFVAREELGDVSGRGAQRYRNLVAAAGARGVQVTQAGIVADSRVERYAHRLPDSLTAQPYRAELSLGELWSPQAFVAAGQSRHLGGGLLAPYDSVAAVVDAAVGYAR